MAVAAAAATFLENNMAPGKPNGVTRESTTESPERPTESPGEALPGDSVGCPFLRHGRPSDERFNGQLTSLLISTWRKKT